MLNQGMVFVIAFLALVSGRGEALRVTDSLRCVDWHRALLINLQDPQILLVRH